MKAKFRNWQEFISCVAMLGNGQPIGVLESKDLGSGVQRVVIKLDTMPDVKENPDVSNT